MMDVATRRRFLLTSGVVGAGALAAGAGTLGLVELIRTAQGAQSVGTDGKLVVVTLYGGNDGLNTVVPYADSAYHSARPELAYDPEEVLRLDDRLGLNPMMRGLKKLWDEKQLAILLGVGYPRPDRSHFRSMDIWQTASPVNPVQTGWVGRWLDGTSAAPEAAVSFEPVLPPILAGETRAGACVSPTGLELPNGITPEMVAALGRIEKAESALRTRAATAYANLLHVERLIREAEQAPRDPAGQELELLTTGTGRTSSLGTQLALVARCVEAGVPTRVYSVSLDGFDTHADERVGHESLLKRLDDALSGFVARMSRTAAGRRVTVVVYSEFGRRVRANASDGTDHGTAGPVFVLGPRVAGGFYGEQPSLTDLDDGDLKANLDLRRVFGTMLGSVLNADPDRYLGGYETTLLPLLKSD